MTDAAREARLLELAREAAKDAHYEFLEVGHALDFATCRHFDCRLVREVATPVETPPCAKCGKHERDHGDFGFRDHAYAPAASAPAEEPPP